MGTIDARFKYNVAVEQLLFCMEGEKKRASSGSCRIIIFVKRKRDNDFARCRLRYNAPRGLSQDFPFSRESGMLIVRKAPEDSNGDLSSAFCVVTILKTGGLISAGRNLRLKRIINEKYKSENSITPHAFSANNVLFFHFRRDYIAVCV